jgi:hypothetical protein
MKTTEQRRKISEGIKKSWAQGKYDNRITKGWPGNNKGQQVSNEVKQKISKTLTGRKLTKEYSNNIGKANLREKSPHWNGDNTGYGPKHMLIYLEFGKASDCWNKECEHISKKYHWANLSGLYSRDFDDWAMLCVKCHSQYDHGLIDLNLKEESWQFS